MVPTNRNASYDQKLAKSGVPYIRILDITGGIHFSIYFSNSHKFAAKHYITLLFFMGLTAVNALHFLQTKVYAKFKNEKIIRSVLI